MFVHLVEVAVRSKVTYYSIKIEVDGRLNEKTEMQLFFEKHLNNPVTKEWAQDLYEWLNTRIGIEKGAEERLFRSERHAQALPPNIQAINKATNYNLRLYCVRVNEQIVILLNGGMKTARTAQECEIVGPHFKFANQFAHSFWKAIKNGVIQIDKKNRVLLFNNPLNLNK